MSSKSLKKNTVLYNRFGISKSIYSSIDSRDFKGLQPPFQPWLDTHPSKDQIQQKPGFSGFSPDVRDAILQWPDKGFLILKGFLSEDKVDAINEEVQRLLKQHSVDFNYTGTKIMDAHRHSVVIDDLFKDNQLLNLLSFILGRKALPFQTIQFLEGSRQRAHADVMHMSTYPQGFLIAAWVALEDISADAGPLFYYPGSHLWSYVGNDDLGLKKNFWWIEPHVNARYEDFLEQRIHEKGVQPLVFLAKKGDVLIWHANLLHGGMPVLNPSLTRKSMVSHYFAEGVICYHEISQRPAVM